MMTFESIEKEACALPTVERRRLIAHLVALQVMRSDFGRIRPMGT